MRKPLILFAVALVIVAAWYGVWRGMMASDVARVKASIEFQNQRLKTTNRFLTLKSDGVYATGWPFHFRVGVARATMSMVSGQETFAVSIPELYLELISSDEGRYAVVIPPTVDALYAIDGAAPESYKVRVDPMPALQLRALGDSDACSNFPGGTRCAAVSAEAPLITYALQLPQTVILHMALNGDARDASFTLIPLNIPIFQLVPSDMSGPLQLFVGVLREALVFKSGDPE